MSLVATWTEIANYLAESKGLQYLDNPSEWIDAFKEVVKDARYIGVDNAEGVYVFNQPIDWFNVGKNVTTALDGGSKSLPTVTNVITDVATGTATVGSSAVATEATGITIALTGAGVAAAVLSSIGLGVASYYEFPEFYTDLLNAMLGTDFSYEDTAPLTWDEVKCLVGVDDITPQNPSGNIYTYLPTVWFNNAYNYVAPMIHVNEVENTFDSAVFSTSQHGKCTRNAVQDLEPQRKNFVSLNAMNEFMVKVADLLHAYGFNNAKPLVMDNLYAELQENCDLSGYDYVGYVVRSQKRDATTFPPGGYIADWDLWNNNFMISDGVYERRIIFEIHAYNFADWEYLDKVSLMYKKNYQNDNDTPAYKGYTTSVYNTIERRLDVRYTVSCSKEGFPYTDIQYTDIPTNPNYEGMYPTQMRYSGNAPYSPIRFIGVYPALVLQTDAGIPYDITGFNGTGDLDGIDTLFYTDDPLAYEEYSVDEAWQDWMHVVGKPPKEGMSFNERYPETTNKTKQVAQPDKYGNEKVTDFTKVSVRTGSKVADQVINHGINNPDDEDSYNQSQDSALSGKDTPTDNPIEDVNDSTQNNKKEYNDSDTSPETAPYPAPDGQPLPDYPENPPQDPDGDSEPEPDIPIITGVTASGMVSVYNPTKQQIIDFSGWLWSPSFLDNFLKIFQNPIDGIIGLHLLFATPHTDGVNNIIVGYLDSGVSSKVVDQQFIELDCGYIDIPEYYGNALDYEPYVQIHIYLPFVGIQALKPNDVIGKRVYLKYGIDVLTGTCLAMITAKKGDSTILTYTFAGNCAVQIPISGGNYAQMITGLAGFIVGTAGAVATSNPIMALGAGASLLNSHLDVSHSGSIGSNAGAVGPRKPFVIVTRKSAYNASEYNRFYGLPSNNTVRLSNCKGFTQVKSCHVESIYRATDNEKQEIETLLKTGVIIA